MSAVRNVESSKAPRLGSVGGARKLFQHGRMVVLAAKGSLTRSTLYRSPTVREKLLCKEISEVIGHFVDGDIQFASLRLAKRFGGVEAVLTASEGELLSVISDEPRLVRALKRSRYFSALRVA